VKSYSSYSFRFDEKTTRTSEDSLCLLGLFDTGHGGACIRETFPKERGEGHD
jgi:hypothetical protein